ncbi:hypothetical protein DNTS_030452 [Danionella cerebrum]|uniref:Uncharacterized protein n=1 Tax=Danionella cerebrum TaxID=2873325 RepID=A0A553MLW0_9TELE|nr:hypothetical protein DNTS_030452 [Danionella translucida]
MLYGSVSQIMVITKQCIKSRRECDKYFQNQDWSPFCRSDKSRRGLCVLLCPKWGMREKSLRNTALMFVHNDEGRAVTSSVSVTDDSEEWVYEDDMMSFSTENLSQNRATSMPEIFDSNSSTAHNFSDWSIEDIQPQEVENFQFADVDLLPPPALFADEL